VAKGLEEAAPGDVLCLDRYAWSLIVTNGMALNTSRHFGVLGRICVFPRTSSQMN